VSLRGACGAARFWYWAVLYYPAGVAVTPTVSWTLQNTTNDAVTLRLHFAAYYLKTPNPLRTPNPEPDNYANSPMTLYEW